MSLEVQNLDQAISLLKKVVKYSAVEGQKHIDFSICLAEDRVYYQKALMLAQSEVENGTLTSEELKQKLGLIK